MKLIAVARKVATELDLSRNQTVFKQALSKGMLSSEVALSTGILYCNGRKIHAPKPLVFKHFQNLVRATFPNPVEFRTVRISNISQIKVGGNSRNFCFLTFF